MELHFGKHQHSVIANFYTIAKSLIASCTRLSMPVFNNFFFTLFYFTLFIYLLNNLFINYLNSLITYLLNNVFMTLFL